MPHYFTLSSFAPSLCGSIGSVSLQPKSFFEKMERHDGYQNSVIFLLIILFVPSLIDSYQISQEKMASILPAMEGVGLLMAWMWAGYIYWCIRLFTDHQLEHTDAFQISAYSMVPMMLDISVLMIVPAYLWQLFITWRALVSFVGISNIHAAWIMAIPVVMLTAAVVAFTMMAAMSGFDFISPLIDENYVEKPYR